ncbi:MAG: linear amide C-N hydrolase, partial [Clostridia bacterium]|nr:linear amide C-N hydrolase [Clostridia bacterium]
MCTAFSFRTRDHYFGRNLDLERTYGEEVTFMPRRFLLEFRQLPPLPRHYAMLGMAHIAEG